MKAAEATGGESHSTSMGSLMAGFGKIFDEYRQSYVLQYDLTAVAREGWHDLTVKVTRSGRYDVRA